MAPDPTTTDVDEGAAVSVPDSGDTGEGGKLKMIVQLVKKCLGVKDIASMRLSLPASLLEPIPNLEFSHYLDRPDYFAAINDYDDPFDRMLAVIRFAMCRDLKLIRGKVCKPYNSVLGEHFRAHWDVPPLIHDNDDPPIAQIHSSISNVSVPALNSDAASLKSVKSTKSFASSFLSKNKDKASPSTAPTSIEGGMSQLNLSSADNKNTLRVVYLTEQISHHPPVSAYYGLVKTTNVGGQVELLGIDQISAKVSGTTLKIIPGGFNKGMFVKVRRPMAGKEDTDKVKEDIKTEEEQLEELYHTTHPTYWVNGILRGSFYVTVTESLIVSCITSTTRGGSGPGGFRAVVEYKEESWLGKANFRIEGVIHTVPGSGSSPRGHASASKDSGNKDQDTSSSSSPDNESADADADSSSSLSEDSADDDDVDDENEEDSNWEQWTKVKHVPPSRVVAVLEGSWRGEIRWKRVGSGSYTYSDNRNTTNTTQHTQHAYTAPSSPNPSHTALPNPSKHPKSNMAESKGDLSLPATGKSKESLQLPAKDTKGKGAKGTTGTAKVEAKGEGEWNTLIDLSTLFPVPKQVRPLDRQEKYESRKLWEGVTSKLLKKEFSEATKEKVVIEQRQRDEAGERKRKGEEFTPKFFIKDSHVPSGVPELSEEGKKAVEGEFGEGDGADGL
ncbi:hypothetical protein D9758_008242 [Tetrapyrgos nigripes]|uniref:Oxysterol-binding protein n=1 Tax=Tetrapyrgos nigripes TaxID=182062 RepID=A0A8H5G1I0_9AGAR|nr:hypothetical protein D9758_008242 [Tetrapyrgos nigripes]